MTEDLRVAMRWLRARPGPALVAVACLALGIGANIALFGVLEALLFRPPVGVSQPESLVRVRVGSTASPLARGAGPTATFVQYRTVAEERSTLLARLAAYGRRDVTRGGGGDASPLDARVVTGNYFDVLGVEPRLGRFFDPTEGVPGASIAVTVLGHRYWERAFGADPAALGRSIRVNGIPLTVIGVAPEGFVGVDLGEPDLWIPMGLVALPAFGGEGLYGRGSYWLQLVGRLRPTVSLAQARAMTAPDPAESDPFVAQPYDPSDEVASATLPVTLLPLRTMFFEDQQGRNPVPPWTLGISVAILILACGTVANVLLAEAVERRRDVAIRLAIGGSPGRIVRQHLVRSVILAVAEVPRALGAEPLLVVGEGHVRAPCERDRRPGGRNVLLRIRARAAPAHPGMATHGGPGRSRGALDRR